LSSCAYGGSWYTVSQSRAATSSPIAALTWVFRLSQTTTSGPPSLLVRGIWQPGVVRLGEALALLRAGHQHRQPRKHQYRNQPRHTGGRHHAAGHQRHHRTGALPATPVITVARVVRAITPHQASTGNLLTPYAADCEFVIRLGACPTEAGLAGTTPQQVKQSLIGAGTILAGALTGPLADAFGLLGSAAAEETAGGTAVANPLGGTMNCVACAIAGDARLSGSAASALDVGPTAVSQLEDMNGGSFRSVSGRGEIESIL
jgi:hypothetical protein